MHHDPQHRDVRQLIAEITRLEASNADLLAALEKIEMFGTGQAGPQTTCVFEEDARDVYPARLNLIVAVARAAIEKARSK